jgi:hypothetical protein
MKMLINMGGQFFARDYISAVLEEFVGEGDWVIVFVDMEALEEFTETNEIEFRAE